LKYINGKALFFELLPYRLFHFWERDSRIPPTNAAQLEIPAATPKTK
jgi:hypothetical protein